MNIQRLGLAVIMLMIFTVLAHAETMDFDKQMQPVLEQYLKIPKTLATDKTDGIKKTAKEVVKLSGKLDTSSITGKHAEHYKNLPGKIKTAAQAMADAEDIATMREALKKLSQPMAMWATMSKPHGVSVMYCSMAPGSWLQQNDTTVANPYYGAKMLRCGEIVSGEGAGQSDGHMKHGGKH